MSATQGDAYQLTKAQLSKQRELMKSDAARDYLAKRQKNRGGVGNGFYKLQARTTNGKAPGEVTKADGYIRTIYDMIDFWYGFVPEYQKQQGVEKADSPVTSSTGGYRNAVYGSEVFSLVNSEPNIFALLENRAWTKSGERAVDAHGHTMGEGGHGETDALPDTNHPSVVEFEQDPQTIAHNFDVSQEEQLLSMTDDDDIEDPFDWLRRWYGTGTEHQTGMGEHPKHINVQLGSASTRSEGNGDTFEDAIEPIDRAIADKSEADQYGGSGEFDIYGFDRTSGEFESNVIHGAGGTVTFTTDTLDDLIRLVKSNSGRNPVTDDNYFFLTNHDTYQRIENEVGGKERLEPQRVSVGLNGVETQPGGDVGITVQSYKQIPIFESVDVQQDDLGRVYLVDSSTMYIKTLLPTQFYSTGTEVDGMPFAIDQMANEGMFATIGQLTCVNPAAQAKARDLA